ncbi:MAG: DUF6089 family protein [Chitinophagaceae bacterium]
MKKLLFITILFTPLLSISQQLHLNLFGGFSNYMGDIQDKPVTFDQSNGALGAGLQYDISNHISLRTSLLYGKVSAEDRYNRTSLQPRNLSFESKIVEGNLLVEYDLFDLSVRKFTPYFFGGIAVYHFNPYAFDTLGYQVFLKPLSTEGQGLAQYPAKKPYKLTQFAIPLGAGFKFRVGDNVTLGYEIGMRKLFTDYLDDLSTTYVDQATLAAARGSKAIEMAYRGGELKNATTSYPVDGTIRGGAKQKDWYYFQGITLSIGLRSGNADGWGRSRTGCPVKVL